MTFVIYNINNATFKPKMASFDYDWTLVNPKDGKTFPTSIEDWMWLYPEVPDKVKKYSENEYMIVVFTNQSKKWKLDQVKMVMERLNIALFIVIATEKEFYKPNPFIFTTFIGDNVINKSESFFIGDALGRKTDFSDSDKLFADNIGIKCHSPEEFFVTKDLNFEIPNIPLSSNPEIIIMVGYPGSGKTTIAEIICKNDKYIHIAGDIYKTPTKMIKASQEYIKNRLSIVFDATHSSIKKRKLFIDLGNNYNYDITCINMTTSFDMSYKRNKQRSDDKQVPKIAYYVYRKHYEEPTESEGFKLIKI